MFDGLKQAWEIGRRSFQRSSYRMLKYLLSGTDHKWLDRTLGVVFLAISIVLAVLFLGELGRETGLWIPRWDRIPVGENNPGWADVPYFGFMFFLSGVRAYHFFKPDNWYKDW